MLKIKIDYEQIKINLQSMQKITGYGENAIPMLKANGYAFDLEKVAKILMPRKKFFVYSVDEGIRLRKLLNDVEIYVCASVFPLDSEYFKKYNLIPVINSFEHLQNCPTKDVILQFNTGMNRNGIEMIELQKIREYTQQNNNVIMVMSHMGCAGDKSNIINQKQIDNFRKVAEVFNEKSISKNLTASEATLNFDLRDFCDGCRIGEYLYFGEKMAFDIRCPIENNTLKVGLKNGFLTDYAKNGYVLVDDKKVKIKSMDLDKIYLEETKGDEAIIINNDFKEFGTYSNTDQLDATPRIMANVVKEKGEGQKIFATKDSYYSQIVEVRLLSEDGVVGYGGTREIKKGEKLAVFPAGYLDGLERTISNTGSVVYINDKQYEIYGRISMDQTIIKVDDDVKVGAKVVVYDKKYPKKRFAEATGKSEEELFYMADKSHRVKYEV
jgi:alanine racemase